MTGLEQIGADPENRGVPGIVLAGHMPIQSNRCICGFIAQVDMVILVTVAASLYAFIIFPLWVKKQKNGLIVRFFVF